MLKPEIYSGFFICIMLSLYPISPSNKIGITALWVSSLIHLSISPLIEHDSVKRRDNYRKNLVENTRGER